MIIIVCGMHRSGTSAMAGMLHGNGIVMGKPEDWYPPPMRENPLGFYENVRFRRINDKILGDSGYKVKSFDPDMPHIKPTDDIHHRQAMKRLVAEFGQYKYWGWKDPRTNLTLLSWWSVIREVSLTDSIRLIFMVRPVREVSNSMKARGNKEKYEGQFEELAGRYNSSLFTNIEVTGLRHKMVAFHDLIHNTRKTAKSVSDFIGKEIEDISFIDPTITGGPRVDE